MNGPGIRYVRTIFTEDGVFTLVESRHGPEEVLDARAATGGGWHITVVGYGNVIPEIEKDHE